jgi:hypothetical protein
MAAVDHTNSHQVNKWMAFELFGGKNLDYILGF